MVDRRKGNHAVKRKKFGYDWTLTVLREQMARAARECYDTWDWTQVEGDAKSPLCCKIAKAMKDEVQCEMDFEAWIEERGGEVVLKIGADGEYYYVWIPVASYLVRHEGAWYGKGGFGLRAGDIRIEAAK